MDNITPFRKPKKLTKEIMGDLLHDIRTPLAVIKTSTEVLLMDPTITAEQRKTLEGTIIELDRIAEIITNTLTEG